MDENRKEESRPVYIPAESVEPLPVRFTRRHWLALGMSVLLAVLFFAVFNPVTLFENGMAGLGATAFVFALFAAVFIFLGKNVSLTREALLLTAATLLLALSLMLFADPAIRMLNYLICLLTGAMAVFSLSGQSRYQWRQWRVVPDTVYLSLRALLSHVFAPFRALRVLRGEKKGGAAGVLVGLLIAIPLLCVVLPLLISADAVFGSLFTELRERLNDLGVWKTVWRVVRDLLLALLLSSAFYTLSLPKKAAEERDAGERRPFTAACCTLLSLLCAVYAVFVAIQLAFLFGGAEAASMSGGYAEYARTGFFQLVAVAAINLAVLLVCSEAVSRAGVSGARALRILGCVLLAFTAVILASAAWRMCLYVSAYGLSLLRLLTFWAMAVIALLLIGAGVKLFRTELRFFALLFVVVIAGWLALCYANPDARVANYNVDAYLNGRLPEVDVYYLASLSADSAPALIRLRDTVGGDYRGDGDSDFYLDCDLDDAINITAGRSAGTGWNSWSVSRWRYERLLSDLK